MKFLVVGASGRFAHHIVPELKRSGAEVYALTRSEGSGRIPARGIDGHRFGDLHDLASLQRACKGMDGVFHLNPAFAPDEAQLGLNMVRAAESSGVQKFAFSGVIHPSISDMVNHSGKRPVEEALYGSSLTFTVLQPAMFMQTTTSVWPSVVEQGFFALPYSMHQKACYVDYRDVAAAAAIALTTDRLDYGTFELCSQGMYDRVEVAAFMSSAANRKITAAEVSFSDWADRMKMEPGVLRDGLQKMYAHYDRFGFRGGNSLVLTMILGRQPRTLEAFFEEMAQAKADRHQPTGLTSHASLEG